MEPGEEVDLGGEEGNRIERSNVTLLDGGDSG